MFWHTNIMTHIVQIVTLYRKEYEMTPKGKKQVTNAELDEIVPLVQVRHTNQALIELLSNAIHQLSGTDEKLEKAIKAKKKKKDEES